MKPASGDDFRALSDATRPTKSCCSFPGDAAAALKSESFESGDEKAVPESKLFEAGADSSALESNLFAAGGQSLALKRRLAALGDAFSVAMGKLCLPDDEAAAPGDAALGLKGFGDALSASAPASERMPAVL